MIKKPGREIPPKISRPPDSRFLRPGTLLSSDNILITSNYVLIETFALVQHRLGIEAVRGFQEDIIPLLNIEWVNPEVHDAGIGSLITASKRKLSLVDCVSFQIIRQLGFKEVFAFDPHYSEQGFILLT